jgi:hypothetical protein
MKLEIGLTAGNYNILTLYNRVQVIPLEDSREVEEDVALDGTPYFNVLGTKKVRFDLEFEEIETEIATSSFKILEEYSIPEYLLPVFIKFNSARLETSARNYTNYAEYEGLAFLRLVQKSISTTPTLRNFNIRVYALQN